MPVKVWASVNTRHLVKMHVYAHIAGSTSCTTSSVVPVTAGECTHHAAHTSTRRGHQHVQEQQFGAAHNQPTANFGAMPDVAGGPPCVACCCLGISSTTAHTDTRMKIAGVAADIAVTQAAATQPKQPKHGGKETSSRQAAQAACFATAKYKQVASQQSAISVKATFDPCTTAGLGWPCDTWQSLQWCIHAASISS